MPADILIERETGRPVPRGGRLRHLLIGPPTPLDRLKAGLARVGDWLIRHTVEWVPADYREDFGRAAIRM